MKLRALSVLLASFALLAQPVRAAAPDGWTAAWASAQMVPVNDQVVPGEWLEDATVRTVVRVGLTGPRLRLRLSNAHGTAPLAIGGLWLWMFLTELRQRPLLATGDPYLREALETGGGH